MFGFFSRAVTRFVELLQKDYVISEAKKGYYRFLDDDERQKARIEEEKLIEQKGTPSAALLVDFEAQFLTVSFCSAAKAGPASERSEKGAKAQQEKLCRLYASDWRGSRRVH